MSRNTRLRIGLYGHRDMSGTRDLFDEHAVDPTPARVTMRAAELAMNRKLGIVIIVGAVVVLLLLIVGPPACRTGDIGFDSSAWKARGDDEGKDARRWRMRRDLESHVRRGMSKAEVRSVFGAPDQGNTERRWTYGLTWDGSEMSSARYFVIDFDSENRVARW